MCSIPIITTGIWVASQPENQCIHWVRWPVVLVGAAVLLVSLAGFAGAYWNKEGLLSIYLVFMAILILLLLSLLIAASVATRPGGGAAYGEEGYSGWLRDHVAGEDYWGGIKACLAADYGICRGINDVYSDANNLSPLQLGCCKPPTKCGFQYVNPTTLINPTYPTIDSDCSVWSNDPTEMCYGCDSCKAGILGNLRKQWQRANIVLVIALVLLTCVYIVACSAYRNAQNKSGLR
ncbi:unnamed protein product [Cuscuta campestris]|uniref:Tetraspanin n=1 Tax=Cuscuta campestris TaxID=132261 RepID=A0A484M359_9ASTE|nr:unnamed protein product [Cuscuta campestris]